MHVRRAMGALGALVALAGCAPVQRAAEFAPGWTQLPDSPLPADRHAQVAFWAGDRLVVAGGDDGGPVPEMPDTADVRPTGETASYRPATASWVAEEPLVVPGYDGVLDAQGAWTGDAWLGVGLPCHDGRIPENELQQTCGAYLGLRWDATDGWTPLPPPPDDALREEWPDRPPGIAPPRPVGVLGDSVVFSSWAGWSVLDPSGHWSLTPWPSVAPPGGVAGRCVLDGELWVTTTDDPTIDAGGPVHETEGLTAIDLATGDFRMVWSGQTGSYEPGTSVACPDTGPLVQPDIGTGPIFAVDDDTVRQLPDLRTPPSAHLPEWPLLLLGAVPVGGGLLSLGDGFEQSWYLDTATLRLTFFPGTAPNVDPVVWSGEHLYLHAAGSLDHPAAGQWFTLNPDGFGPSLADATFPIPADTGYRHP